MDTVGRFAPSPTGPLHLGSLVAAVGSWLFARARSGRWLVRMEDLDSPRVIAGADRDILEALERYGLVWDGEVAYQSRRVRLYEEALASLRASGVVFDCACSRADLQRSASAPAATDPSERVYAGTCRNGIPAGRPPRAVRFSVADRRIAFDDLVLGDVEEDLAVVTGDFVVKRADGVFAYQLAVVVDDAEQGVTQVVRGADLAGSTARQIALQEALGYPRPAYAHLPLIVNQDGSKLGKRDGALPLPSLDEVRVAKTLRFALSALGQTVAADRPDRMLAEVLARFDPALIPRVPQRIPAATP